ncbi:MAG TPA: ribosome silencing factor [Candidatus Kapabacteria bacterium]|nr:ribosome silencing factor [Candidatus Kapabacteria bacterium]HOV91610.1 ribosome silencing factor [Candidatus Kapabacteria bacterium]
MTKITKPRDSRQLAIQIAHLASNKLAENILILDMRKIDSAPADYFVICSALSTSQSKAIYEEIYITIKNMGIALPKTEGTESMDWIVLDYFDVVVHIMSVESRSYYKLERLWSDAKFQTIEDDKIVNFDRNSLKDIYLIPTV